MVVAIDGKVNINGKFYATGPDLTSGLLGVAWYFNVLLKPLLRCKKKTNVIKQYKTISVSNLTQCS